ncbi:CBS domain-containing protein, partial [Jeotgalibaca porci]
LQELVKHLQKEMGKTVVFVTHDMDEALKLADRIAIMQDGKVVQFDTPDNILANPANEFVEDFIGEERLTQAQTNLKTVEQIMNRRVITLEVGKTMADAIKVMRAQRVDNLFIIDEDQKLLGILSVEIIEKNRRRNVMVEEVMEEVLFVREGALVRDALQRILTLGYKNIPVVDEEDRLIGLITRASIVDIVYDSIWKDADLDELEEVIETTIIEETEATEQKELIE